MSIYLPEWAVIATAATAFGVVYLLIGAIVIGLFVRWMGSCPPDAEIAIGFFILIWPAFFFAMTILVIVTTPAWLIYHGSRWLVRLVAGREV